MKFSVITPVLNGMPQIKRCVGSVRNQREVAVEHIVEDACSTDRTTQWLLEQTDLRVESRPDKGMYDAINRGWSRATGDVFSWLNADEQYLPGALALVRDCFASHPTVDVVFGDCILVDVEGRPLSARKEIALRRWYVLNSILYAQSCATFIRRRTVETCGGFDASYRILGDLEWMLRIMGKGGQFRHIPHCLGLFTLSGQNLSRAKGVLEERERVRQRYGGYRAGVARLVPRICRCVEKLGHGCYGRHRVRYMFMKDEQTWEEVEARVGSFWRWPAARA